MPCPLHCSGAPPACCDACLTRLCKLRRHLWAPAELLKPPACSKGSAATSRRLDEIIKWGTSELFAKAGHIGVSSAAEGQLQQVCYSSCALDTLAGLVDTSRPADLHLSDGEMNDQPAQLALQHIAVTHWDRQRLEALSAEDGELRMHLCCSCGGQQGTLSLGDGELPGATRAALSGVHQAGLTCVHILLGLELCGKLACQAWTKHAACAPDHQLSEMAAAHSMPGRLLCCLHGLHAHTSPHCCCVHCAAIPADCSAGASPCVEV